MAGGLFGGGTGTAEDPYLVEDGEDLVAVGQLTDRGESLGTFFKQAENIDLALFLNWQPICTLHPFVGSYDGQLYEINNLKIEKDDEVDFFSAVGLFSRLGSSAILNGVQLVNADVHGDQFVGALVGEAETGNLGSAGITISNCSASGKVTGVWNSTGGLVGYIGGLVTTTLVDCYTSCDVIGDDEVGGLIGGSWEAPTITERCYAEGDITGSKNVGGLLGYAYTNGTIFKNSFALNKFIKRKSDSVETTFGDIYGGKMITAPIEIIIENCYSIDTMQFVQE